MSRPSSTSGKDHAARQLAPRRRGLAPGPHAQYHNVFGMLMVRATREGISAARPAKRPFVLTRSNFLGGQRYAATWTGDNASTWTHLRMAIPMTLNLGLSGQPFNGRIWAALACTLIRSSGAMDGDGALFPFCAGTRTTTRRIRNRGCSARKSSRPRESPWTGATAPAYIYTLFYESSLNGAPVLIRCSSRTRAIRPCARRARSFSSARISWSCQGGRTIRTCRAVSGARIDRGRGSADKFQVDLRVRGGAILPLGRVVQNTTEESLDPLTLLVSPDELGNASGLLFEDAGDGYGYQSAIFFRPLQGGNPQRPGCRVRIGLRGAARPAEAPGRGRGRHRPGIFRGSAPTGSRSPSP